MTATHDRTPKVAAMTKAEARPLTPNDQHALNQKLDEVAAALQAHISTNDLDHERLHDKLAGHIAEEERLNAKVFGNGNLGMAELQRNDHREIQVLRESMLARDRMFMRAIWSLATPLTLGVLALLWQMVRTYLKGAPLAALLLFSACRAPDVYTVGVGHSEGEDDFSHPRNFQSDTDSQSLLVGAEWHVGAQRQHEEVLGQLRANQIAALTGDHTEPVVIHDHDEEPETVAETIAATIPETTDEAIGALVWALGACLLLGVVGLLALLLHKAGVRLPFQTPQKEDPK